MANGINHVTVGGNLGDDPSVKYTQSGTCVMSISLACNETYLDRNHQRQESVEWIRCTVWGKRAEGLAKFLKKGTWILVEGSLKTSKWTDREGIERWKTEVVAKNVFLGGTPSARGNAARSRNQGRDPQERKPIRRDDDDDGGYDSQERGEDGYDDGGEWNQRGDDSDIPF